MSAAASGGPADPETIVYRSPRTLAFVYQAAAVGFMGLGLWMLVPERSGDAGTTLRLFGSVCIFLAGLCAVSFGRKSEQRQAVYAITPQGFTLGQPGEPGHLTVGWEEVQGVGIATIGEQKVLSFAFRDPERVKARMPDALRMQAEANETAGFPILSIPQSALEQPVEDVAQVSTRYFYRAE